MSGGSWDYFYSRLEDVANRLIEERSRPEYELRAALGRKLLLAAKALHDIEWVDSCDYGAGDETEAIKMFLGGEAYNECLKTIRLQLEELGVRLERIEKLEAGEK